MGNTFTMVPASALADTYSTRMDVEAIYGSADVATYADVDADGDAAKIEANIAAARVYAYDWINSVLRSYGLTAPATADSFDDFPLLKYIEAERAGAFLYFKRGRNDANAGQASADGAMQWHWDNAEKELMRILESATGSDNVPGVFESVDLRRHTPCLDENGQPLFTNCNPFDPYCRW